MLSDILLAMFTHRSETFAIGHFREIYPINKGGNRKT